MVKGQLKQRKILSNTRKYGRIDTGNRLTRNRILFITDLNSLGSGKQQNVTIPEQVSIRPRASPAQ
jgi:hypothetical protein